MMTPTASAATHRHVFNHLGPAPYRYTGCRENRFVMPGFGSKPGGTCDHCGTGILYEFHFIAANGHRFKVGSSCVTKSGDAGLRRVIAADVKAQQKAVRDARKKAKAVEASTLVDTHWPVAREQFVGQPHPHPYFASQGKTYADYLEFCGRPAMAAAIRRWRDTP